jgi:membrane carboxypeptidase/penicillin-binding protein
MDNGARTAAFGPSSQLVIPKQSVSVKTGTTDDYKDNWTIGYTPNFLVLTWVGNNDGTPMSYGLVSGVTGAAPIWNRVMRYVLRNQPDLKPRKPENVIGRQVCNNTGLLASINPDGSKSCDSRFEYFIKGTENMSSFKIEKQVVAVTKDSDKLAPQGGDNTEMKEKTIIKDSYSTFCADCVGDQPTQPTPNP